MPRGNRQGPDGEGPMTGRGLGYCAGYDTPGFETAPAGWLGGRGRGLGRGFGRGRGFRGYGFGRLGPGRGLRYGGSGWYPPYDPGPGYPAAPENQRVVLEEEIDALSRRIEFLKRELDATGSDEGEKK